MDSRAMRRLRAEHVAARALLESATFGDAAPKILAAICDAPQPTMFLNSIAPAGR
jgi:hypothetical protein